MRKCWSYVVFLNVFVVFLGKSTGIILSNEEQPKPSYTAGIKTAQWRNPSKVQTHHNYSKVYSHNNPDGSIQYVVAQTERTQQMYPVYNAHTYGQSPENSERIVEGNSQTGQTSGGHGHFASLVGGNILGLPKTNRTIYKRKLQFKSIEVYEKCPEGATGQFVYYLSCNQFLNCWKGRGEAQNCAPGTLFNPKTLECDFPDKVECLTGPRQNTLEGIRTQKSLTQALCPREFTGLIPNYTDCSKFISCNHGQRTSMDCPPGTLFDINQNVCDFPYKSTCFNAYSTAYQNGTSFGTGLRQSSWLDHHRQYYQQLSGQYYDQNASRYDQQAQQSQHQDASLGGRYYPHISGQGSTGQYFLSSSQPHQTDQQAQAQHSSTENQFGWYGGGYQGQFYQTANSDDNRQLTQNTGQSQYGQTYHGHHQAHHGSGVTGLGHGYHNIESKLDFGQDEGGCSGTSCYNSSGNGKNSENTSQFGWQTGTNTQTGQTVCNPQVQNCYQISGSPQQATTQQQYGQGSGVTYSFNQNWTQNRSQGYGAHDVGYGQTRGFSQTLGQRCNPQYQNCGQISGDSRYNASQVPGTGHSQTGQPNYHKVCNINDPRCHQSGNRNETKTKTRKEPKCPDNFQGITEHPSNCKKFLNCANGQTFIQDCAPGTLFNPALKICDFPYNVDCKDRGEGDVTTIDSNEGTESTDDWQETYYAHAQQYGQNAGHGNIRATTARPETQAVSNQRGIYGQDILYNQGTSYQGQGRYDPGQSSFNQDHGSSQGQETHHTQYVQTPRIYDQGQGMQRPDQNTNGHGLGTYNQEHSTPYLNRDYSSSYKPLTPRPGHVTIISSKGSGLDQTTVSDVNRGQIGIVNRPVYVQTGQDNRRKTADDQRLDQSVNSFPDYVDVFNPDDQKSYGFRSTSPRSVDKSWPPPFPSTDVNADYVFEYDDGEPVTLEPDSVFYSDKKKKTICGKGDFNCTANSCISKTMVCDGQRDCLNGKDELDCQKYLQKFTLRKNHHLDVMEKQRWMNISYTTCALLCIENTKFECRSFNYRKVDKTCFLTDSNIGLSGALRQYYPCDYYELKSATIDCTYLFKCQNDKCITTGQLCDGVDDCGDREDEKKCKPEDFGYSVRLAGSNEKNEGRVEITAFGKTGYICDDQFGIMDANVVCRELGFQLGAAEFKGNSYYAKDLKVKSPLYMMDDLNCFGNETTLLDCGFSGWGVHNCRDQEIAGVVCKTPQEKCGKGYWKCDTGNECVPFSFVCDGLFDCTDDSDEGVQHCEAPTELRLVNGTNQKEGRVEIKHHGIWGTVCDDDFNEDAAKVVCKYFGYKGKSTVKKEAYFGSGEGPIWLDQVSCYGNETELQKCTHWNWGEHNCDHGEDVGVICSDELDIAEVQRHSKISNKHDAGTGMPITTCGFRKDNQFLENDLIHARVVSGSVARKGDYPWQAALRVRGKDKSAHWCGAVIISNRWILTAAHCLQGYAKGAYIVVAGEYNTDEEEGTEQQKYIEEYFIHKHFREGHKMNNDIALIKLKGTGFALNEDVQPICLPDVNANYERELNCTISGFGSVKSGTSAYSHNLMAAWIPIHNVETCKMPHVYGSGLTEGMICAGFLDGGIDACDGDSGGPLACLDEGLFTLYGLTSWGQHCGYANKPGVYVKVAHYRQWIDDIIKKHS